MERSDQPPDDKELWQDFVLKGREESFHLLVQRYKVSLFNAAYGPQQNSPCMTPRFPLLLPTQGGDSPEYLRTQPEGDDADAKQ
jgi:hypothetical protein